MDSSLSVLLLLALLQVKHLFADFYMQNGWMLTGRENYFHLGRSTHAAIHCVFSAVVFLFFDTPIFWVAALAVGEWIIHFHIDYWKARDGCKRELTPADAAFWKTFGVDQTLHHMTYIGMIWIWLQIPA